MYQCSNCEKEVDLAADHDAGCMVLREKGVVVAAICPSCLENVALAKLVVKKFVDSETFMYEQYQPIIGVPF
jgi:hypothetical protein